MKRKKIILTIIIMIIIFIIFASYIVTPKKTTSIKNQKCIDINEKIKSKETFALFITNDLNIEDESNDVVNKYLKIYKNENIYVINNNIDVNKDCITDILLNAGIYKVIKEEQTNSVLCYEKGVFTVSQHTITSYETLENFLDENGIIQKRVIKEKINMSDYKKKKQQDAYILLIISEEDKRDFFTNNMKKVYNNYDYDVINRKSDVGKEITESIKKEYKDFNVYPRLLYFSKNKLVKEKEVYGLKDFQKFKDNLY